MNRDAPDKASSALTVDQRLALLEKVEQQEAARVRKAAGIAWLSLAVAAVLVGVLIFGAWWQVSRLRRESAALAQRQASLVADIKTKEDQLVGLEAKVREREAAVSTIISAFRRTNEQAQGGLATALDEDPRATVLVPRAYVQIVDDGDRQWARNLSDRLQGAGVIPLGIEHTPRAAGLRQFEVRFYKKAEEPGALRVLAVLESVGVPAVTKYLNLENNTRVRGNHFEVWCPANARQFKLKPLPAASR